MRTTSMKTPQALGLALCLFAGAWFSPASARAAFPDTLNYQGRMRLTSGAAVADSGTNSIAFALYTVATGGTAIWSETQTNVSTSEGLFNVQLGSVNPLTGIAFDQPYWLGVDFNGDGEMSPRTRLTAAPYALRAKFAEGFAVPISVSAADPNALIYLSNSDSSGKAVWGIGKPGFANSIGVLGEGGTGVLGSANTLGGTGVYALQNLGGLALKVSGNAQFGGGTVDFAGATVTGLGLSVPVPLSLTNSANADSTINAANTNSGTGVYGRATGAGTSPAIYGFRGGAIGHAGVGVRGEIGSTATNGAAALQAVNSSVNTGTYALWASSQSEGLSVTAAGSTAAAIHGEATFNGPGTTYGVHGISQAQAGYGVAGENGTPSGIGVYGKGGIGILVQTNAGSGTGLRAEQGPGTWALDVSGSARFAAGTVDFNGATVTGLAVGVAAPLSLTLSAAGASPLYVSNGAGTAILGAGQQGVQGQAASAVGTGVRGINSVFGNAGTGVIGANTGSTNSGIGVYGSNVSINGIGVKAENYSLGAALYVTGAAQFYGSVSFVAGLKDLYVSNQGSTQALAVQSSNTGLSVTAATVGVYARGIASGQGVRGVSDNGVGVYGQSALGGDGVYGSGGPVGVGVHGYNDGNGYAVWGENTLNGFGVRGTTDSGNGVFGSSNATGIAIKAVNYGGTALYVSGGVQAFGSTTFTGAVNFNGATVTGLALSVPNPLLLSNTAAVGVIEAENYGPGSGVKGTAAQAGAAFAGVVGQNTATGGTGVRGSSSSNQSVGVHGQVQGALSIGVLAESQSGIALRLSGTASIDSASNTINVLSYVSFTAGSNMGLSVPLNLTNGATADSTIYATNQVGGSGLYGRAVGSGSSAAIYGFRGGAAHSGTGVRGEVSASGVAGSTGVQAVNASTDSGSFGLTAETVGGIAVSATAGTNSALVARNNSGVPAAVLRNDGIGAALLVTGNGPVNGALQVSNPSGGKGIESIAALGVSSTGSGVAGQAFLGQSNSNTNATAEFANFGTGPALRLSGSGVLDAALGTSITVASYVSFTAGTNLAVGGVPNPLSLSGSVSGGAVISSLNANATGNGIDGVGSEVGVSGTATLPGTGIGVLGQANSSSGAGVKAVNDGSGPALLATGQALGLSVSTNSGVAVYAVNNGGGGFLPAGKFVVFGTNHAVEGRNLSNNSLGTLGGDLSNGSTGVFGESVDSSGFGVYGRAPSGFGVVGTTEPLLPSYPGVPVAIWGTTAHDGAAILGDVTVTTGVQYAVRGDVTSPGAFGVYGKANSASGGVGVYGGAGGPGGIGVLASSSNGPALVLSGTAQVLAGPGLTLTVGSFVSFTAGTNLGAGLSLPYNQPAFAPWPQAAFTVTNTGGGHGIRGEATAPGNIAASPDFSSNIPAGVVGYSPRTGSAGVLGMATAVSESAGVIGIGNNFGVYGHGLGAGGGGGQFESDQPGTFGVSAYAPSGTAGSFQGLTGVAASGSAMDLRLSGSGILGASPGLTITVASYVSFSAGTNLSGSSALPISGSKPVNYPFGVVDVQNTGTGMGVVGRATQPGTLTGNLNYGSTLTAGVYGYSPMSISAGVLGRNDDPSGQSVAVAGLSKNGIGVYGISDGASNGTGGQFESVSGTGLAAKGQQAFFADGYSAVTPAVRIRSAGNNGPAFRSEGTSVFFANTTATPLVWAQQVGSGPSLVAEGGAVAVSASSSGGNAIFAQSNGSFAPTSYFIQGTSDSTAGSAIAVYGQARNSPAGIGIFGYAASVIPSFPTTGASVYGFTDRVNGAAVWGRAQSNGAGVIAEGASAGVSATAGTVGPAVYAANQGSSTNAAAVVARNTGAGSLATGVYATGTNGVIGANTTTPVLYDSAGIYGESNSLKAGVYGFNTGGGPGVTGYSINGVGVSGTSNNSPGVQGYSAGIQQAGVEGVGTQTGANYGYGVRGVASLNDGSRNAGVYGSYGSPPIPQGMLSGAGVVAANNVNNGWGLYAVSNLTGNKAVVADGGLVGVSATAMDGINGVGGYFSAVSGVAGYGTRAGVEGSTNLLGVGASGGGGVVAKNSVVSTPSNPAIALDIDGGILMKTSRSDPSAGVVAVPLGGCGGGSNPMMMSGSVAVTSNQIRSNSVVLVSAEMTSASPYPVVVRTESLTNGNVVVTVHAIGQGGTCPGIASVNVHYLIINRR